MPAQVPTVSIEQLRDTLDARLRRVFEPLTVVLARIGVTPNQLSVAGIVLNLLAAALVVGGELPLAGLTYLAAGVFDLLDGSLARKAGRETAFGAFLDSTLDRISEGVVFAAIALHLARSGGVMFPSLVVLALLGSFLVSYTRARAEKLGCECKVGLASRAERVVLIAAGLAFGLVAEVIVVLVALTAFTTAQRMIHVSRQLRSLH